LIMDNLIWFTFYGPPCICYVNFLSVKIENLMKQHDCAIRWPQTLKEKLTLHCTIDTSRQDAVFAATKWHERCHDALKKELDNLRCSKLDVPSQIWQQLKEAVSKQWDRGTHEMLLVRWDENAGAVFFAGVCTAVDQFEKEVSQIVVGLEQELRKKQQQVTEKRGLKPFQTRLLRVKDFTKTCSSAKCSVTISKDEAVFVGEASEVLAAQKKMFKLLSAVTVSTLGPKSPAFTSVLSKEHMEKRIMEKMISKNVFATYSTIDEEVTIYSFSEKEAAEAGNIIKAEVVEKKFFLCPNGRACLTSSEWKQFQSDVGKLGKPAAVCEDGCSVVAVTVPEEMHSLESQVKKFINRNTIEKEFVSMPTGVIDVLQKYAAAEVDEIKRSFNKHAADVRFVSSAGQMGCEVTATSAEIRQIADAVKALECKVKSKEYRVETPSCVKLLRSSTARASVDAIAGRHEVSIKYPEEVKAGRKRPIPFPVCEVKVDRNKTIRLVSGDITQHAADVIVNAANSRLQHAGGVARAIAKRGKSLSA